MTVKDLIFKVNGGCEGFHAHTHLERKHISGHHELCLFVNIVEVDDEGTEDPFIMLAAGAIERSSWHQLQMIFLI